MKPVLPKRVSLHVIASGFSFTLEPLPDRQPHLRLASQISRRVAPQEDQGSQRRIGGALVRVLLCTWPRRQGAEPARHAAPPKHIPVLTPTGRQLRGMAELAVLGWCSRDVLGKSLLFFFPLPLLSHGVWSVEFSFSPASESKRTFKGRKATVENQLEIAELALGQDDRGKSLGLSRELGVAGRIARE